MAVESGPLLIADDYKRDSPACQVAGNASFCQSSATARSFGLGRRYQFDVSKPVPSAFNGFNNDVALEGASRLRAANSITATICSYDSGTL